MISLGLKLIFASWLAVFLTTDPIKFSQPEQDFWETRDQLESQFRNELEALAHRFDEPSSLIIAAAPFLISRDPKRQYIFLPDENIIDSDRFEDLSAEAKLELQKVLDTYASRLFSFAKSNAGRHGAWSYQLLNEILFYSPNHPGAREVLGHRMVDNDGAKVWRVKSDRLRVKRATKPESGFNWPAKSYWIGSTTHFHIVSTAGEAQTRKLAIRLERWHDVWRQVFFDYHNSSKNLQRWIAGSSKPTPSGRKFKVVFFADRNQYVLSLKDSIPGIEKSTGYYNDKAKKSYFFASDEGSIRDTWRHELTHQLFQESRRSTNTPFRNHYLWLGEGIAMYFESLVDHDHYFTLGGFDARRLQYARLRRLKEQFRFPLDVLSKMNMIQFQSLPEIQKVYSQSAGVTQMLMTADRGADQSKLIQFLSLIYQGKKRLPSFNSQLGRSFEQIENRYEAFLRIKPNEIKFFDATTERQELALIGVRLNEGTFDSSVKFKKLEWLDLSGSDIRGGALKGLNSVQKIDQVFLTGALIDDDTIAALVEVATSGIDISGTKLTDKQLIELVRNASMQTLNIVKTRVTEQGVIQALSKRPDLRILSDFNQPGKQ